MPKRIDLTGKIFGRWKVLGFHSVGKHRQLEWSCVCSCGVGAIVRGTALTSGTSTSCGCYRSELTSKREKTHGMVKTKVYTAWVSMRQRCYEPKATGYANYGGRGIKVCDRWQTFENFLEDMGIPEPGLSLDRIDVNGDYTPENCKWSTILEQNRNKRSAVYLLVDGEVVSLVEYALRIGKTSRQARELLRKKTLPTGVTKLPKG